jgi:hypothetical protein
MENGYVVELSVVGWRDNMNIQFYCDTDEQGNITFSLAGELIIPDRQYDYFFMLESWEVPDNVDKYKVVDRELVLK